MDKIAVLIPCYNESCTIAKVVADWKRVLPEAVVYVMTTIPKTTQTRLPDRRGLWCVMSISRERAM